MREKIFPTNFFRSLFTLSFQSLPEHLELVNLKSVITRKKNVCVHLCWLIGGRLMIELIKNSRSDRIVKCVSSQKSSNTYDWRLNVSTTPIISMNRHFSVLPNFHTCNKLWKFEKLISFHFFTLLLDECKKCLKSSNSSLFFSPIPMVRSDSGQQFCTQRA